jgi:hypothetical protein
MSTRHLRGMVAAMCLTAGAALLATPAGATSVSSQLKPKLLSLADLPSGFSVNRSSDSGVTGNGCLTTLASPKRKYPEESVQYVSAAGLPQIDEKLRSGPGIAQGLKQFAKSMSECKPFTINVQGHVLHARILPLTFPAVGPHSSAFVASFAVSGVTVSFAFVSFEVDGLACVIGFGNLGNPNVGAITGLVDEAINKVEGKPVGHVSLTSDGGGPHSTRLLVVK